MSNGHWERELQKLVSVASAWYQASTADVSSPDSAANYRNLFPPIGNGDPASQLRLWKNRGQKDTWWEVPGFFEATPFQGRNRDRDRVDTFWPLVGFQLKNHGSRLHAMIRVVLYMEDEVGSVDAWGWRFDSADPEVGTEGHPYSHIQHVTTWTTTSWAFQPPDFPEPDLRKNDNLLAVPKTSPEWRPAFPLSCTTPAGLLIAAMISLYGAVEAARVLEAISSADDQFHMLVGLDKTQLLVH